MSVQAASALEEFCHRNFWRKTHFLIINILVRDLDITFFFSLEEDLREVGHENEH